MGVDGADGGDGVANIEDFVLGQQVFGDHASIALDLCEVDHPVFDDREVRGGGNGDDAGQRLGLAGIDAADAGVLCGLRRILACSMPGRLMSAP